MFEMTGGPSVLTEAERGRLERLESELFALEKADGRKGFVYREIKEQRLWREEYLTFETYCNDKWGLTRQQVNRLIAHADVVDEFTAEGREPPRTERQSRFLTTLSDEQKSDVYERVQARGGWEKVSSRQVQAMAHEVAGREVAERRSETSPVVVTTGGRVGVSPRAKRRVLGGLREMAEEADRIQTLGPYAVADTLRAATPEELVEMQRYTRRIGRLMASVIAAARDQGQDWSTFHEEDAGQLALSVAA